MVSNMSYLRIYTGDILATPQAGTDSDMAIHTLARKFEAVHRKTVTRRRQIPKALRPIFCSPRLALKPPGFSWEDRCEDKDSLWRDIDGVSTESPSCSVAAGGKGGSALIVLDLGGGREREVLSRRLQA